MCQEPSIQTASQWAMTNFGSCDLGDARRTKRAVQIAERMADHPGASSPEQMPAWAELKACYRFFDSAAVTFDALARPHWEQTCATASGRVLILNDTTTISYKNTAQDRRLHSRRQGDAVWVPVAQRADG
ncbi:MAG: transposase [Pirellulales bacterium]